jgi:hypothetical protein
VILALAVLVVTLMIVACGLSYLIGTWQKPLPPDQLRKEAESLLLEIQLRDNILPSLPHTTRERLDLFLGKR